jgi:transcriptional regulator with XRE-family HTH domain
MGSMLGTRLLAEWRTKSGLSQAEAAGRFGVSQPTYWAWEKDGAVPKIEQGLLIEKVTKGEVPMRAWATRLEDDQLPEATP